ncbi:helix-turn-helix domain-containing protein [Dyadobacter sandarakinus]|uniref:AraC family transcriptional regulator n=1 Tax=Dyadobacter sandarakinus TaxID=2747268 RepID=A0ABX7I7M7_9BACT|nr:helix-turn-helix domain-containing protein [Dyadobacter sandarakinus]QRR01188.1 AraC family transcriptional regulator [Dyadobacter sandarakinus]
MEQTLISTAKEDRFAGLPPGGAQFRVSGIGEDQCGLASYNRRDYYKISLILGGSSELLYASRGITIDRPALVLTTPIIPYAWEARDGLPRGYFCLFANQFLYTPDRAESLQEANLFKVGADPVYFIDDQQITYLESIFQRMRMEANSEYLYKYDIIRSQLNLIIHEAIKMQPSVAYFNPPNAAARIARLFLDLLERQFPVDAPSSTILFKKAGDFASQLSVHVNHLNAAVQEVTGKSTTTHINERILGEARSLLHYTDRSVAEIAYSLGFEYPSYFNNFIKKHTGSTPLALRKIL